MIYFFSHIAAIILLVLVSVRVVWGFLVNGARWVNDFLGQMKIRQFLTGLTPAPFVPIEVCIIYVPDI